MINICLTLLVMFVCSFIHADFLPESEIHELKISGPLAERYSEISGLTWHNDWLIILPQYPHLFGENGALFYLEKEEIKAFLANRISELTPKTISFSVTSDYINIPGFEGFEAIAFYQDTAYLTIEASPEGMLGYLGKAELNPETKSMLFDSENLVEIESQSGIPNASDETIFIHDEKIFVFHEANGKKVNPKPKAHVYNLNLQFQGVYDFPSIEYRITDATQPQGNIVWMLNYFWSGDEKWYNPADDSLKVKFGYGKTHTESKAVERIIAYEIKDNRLEFADRKPIYLQLEKESRNWEGIVRFEDGFIIATDKHPRTIIAFVKGK